MNAGRCPIPYRTVKLSIQRMTMSTGMSGGP